MPTAMAILRPLIELRLPLREEAMTVLLELMTHPSMSKNFAILSTKVNNLTLNSRSDQKGCYSYRATMVARRSTHGHSNQSVHQTMLGAPRDAKG